MAEFWFITEDDGPVEIEDPDDRERSVGATYMNALGRYLRGDMSEREAEAEFAKFRSESVQGKPLETDLDVLKILWLDGQIEDITWESDGPR
jgi:hypothetical protein